MFDVSSTDHVLQHLQYLLASDSPSGYYPSRVHSFIDSVVTRLGYETTLDQRGTLYIDLPGREDSTHRLIDTHLDTVGLLVSELNPDGALSVQRLGGIMLSTIEGATCHICTRTNGTIVGQVTCKLHSPHQWAAAEALPRELEDFCITIPGCQSLDDLLEIGILPGDLVALEPCFEQHGPVLYSRHLDNKALVAIVLNELRWLHVTGDAIAYPTTFAFPIYEELGQAPHVPPGVSEYVALDITIAKPDGLTSERAVNVLTADAYGPYDHPLTSRLIDLAREYCDHWSAQVLPNYLSDASLVRNQGADVRTAAFGPAVANSHGRERCHLDALVETSKLLHVYLMSD